MALPQRQLHLRLVGSESAEAMATWRASHAVAQENATAARNPQLQPNDPRWVLAAQTAAQLDGDRLAPDARKRIERTARLLGVRAFDASMIMAIVQDHARRNQPVTPASRMLNMVEPARPGGDATVTRWLLALGFAGLAAFAMIRWLTQG